MTFHKGAPDASPSIEITGDANRIRQVLEGKKDLGAQILLGAICVRGDARYANDLAVELGLIKPAKMAHAIGRVQNLNIQVGDSKGSACTQVCPTGSSPELIYIRGRTEDTPYCSALKASMVTVLANAYTTGQELFAIFDEDSNEITRIQTFGAPPP